jgi:uncharacterized protein YbjT (DUF2867 family)
MTTPATPTTAAPPLTVLLPGPLSYLGRRLIIRLLARSDVRVRVLVENRRNLGDAADSIHEIVEGDPMDPEVLRRAAAGVDVAYYPIRFFGGDAELQEARQRFPAIYRDACIAAGVKRLIFLGALETGQSESRILGRLHDTGETLSARAGAIQTIWFRAGLELGSGSLLFEAVRNIVQKSVVLPTPRWMETRIPMIGVRDLLDYLVEAIFLPPGRSFAIDIGAETLTLRQMLATASHVMQLKRYFIPIPFRAMRISPFILMLLSPFSGFLATTFLQVLESLDRDSVSFSTDEARRIFPDIDPAPFDMSVARAVEAIAHEQVISRWTDSIPMASTSDLEEQISRSVFRDVRQESFAGVAPEAVFSAVTSIGGRKGWFSFSLLWRIRGWMDKLLGGFGTSPGRRSDSALRVGDYLDVWKVVDLQENRRLLLEAHMRVGGRAWLEFRIVGDTLIQTAYHYPSGLLGRLYWFSMLPFHAFIFPDMIRSIVRRARTES